MSNDTIQKLTGQKLLDYVHANPTKSHTENCTACGYLKELKDGTQGCDYLSFYEALLEARKTNGEYQEPKQSGAEWYDSLTDQDRELYDMIEERCPEFEKLDAEQCQEFMDELSEHGITTADDFESAYFYQTDSYNPERDFAEYVTTEVNCVDIPDYIYNHINWQSMWDCELCYEFFTIEFDGETYFFNSNF